MAFIELKNVKKTYDNGQIKVNALQDASFEIQEGELVIILGPSGTGKSTLLNVIGGIDTVTSGSIFIDGEDITKYTEKKLIQYRRNDVGFVFQDYNLLDNLTAYENIQMSIELKKQKGDVLESLKKVGLENRINHYPSQLSGGEKQRVAIARAFIKNPKLLLCDEPTGALDYENSKQIFKLLKEICITEKKTVIIITHNHAISDIANKVIRFNNGKVEEIIINEKTKNIDEIWW